MKEDNYSNKNNPYSTLNIKDIFFLILFILIPFVFFATNFASNYKVIYYAILSLFAVIYTLIGQFFFESERTGTIGKKLFSIMVINSLILPFIQFTGNLDSPYFFIIYFLIFAISIFASLSTLVLECIVIFASLFVSQLYDFSIFDITLLKTLTTLEIVRLLSIPISLPLAMTITSYIDNLQKKKELLKMSKQLLEISDIEDETLLEGLNQGVIILDSDLKIIKLSKWVESNFNLASKLLLGKYFNEIAFYDPVSYKKLLSSDFFYKNLKATDSQELTWRALYKNQYDKFIKFIIKQSPLQINNQNIGFLLSIKLPPKNITEYMGSFNRFLSFRLSSNIAMVRNYLHTIPQIQNHIYYASLKNNVNAIIEVLNDVSIRNEITEGNYEITISNFDIKDIVNQVLKRTEIQDKVSVWNISPYYKNVSYKINSDIDLLEHIINYSIKGAYFLSNKQKVNLTFDEDENIQKPRIQIVSDFSFSIDNDSLLIEPFFHGELNILSKYQGTGLEISNADLIAKYLGFDFNLRISNNKLLINIIF